MTVGLPTAGRFVGGARYAPLTNASLRALVSGVPASLVPADRRKHFFDNHLRSQSDALNLVRQLERGNVSR